jgi:sterol desaturase/sphingolipid hydroxylase (fatty acid hydroxylase superfamily)
VVTFGTIFLVMAVWELAGSRRPQATTRGQRWPANLLIVALDTLAVRLIFPLTAIGASVLAAGQGWGLFNMTPVPTWLAVIACVVLLDMAIYFQHRLFHAVPWLWRLHRVHHSVIRRETNSNFGFNLPWWDRLFGTYVEQPAMGHLGMTIGLEEFRDPRELRLDRMLVQPFLSDPA